MQLKFLTISTAIFACAITAFPLVAKRGGYYKEDDYQNDFLEYHQSAPDLEEIMDYDEVQAIISDLYEYQAATGSGGGYFSNAYHNYASPMDMAYYNDAIAPNCMTGLNGAVVDFNGIAAPDRVVGPNSAVGSNIITAPNGASAPNGGPALNSMTSPSTALISATSLNGTTSLNSATAINGPTVLNSATALNGGTALNSATALNGAAGTPNGVITSYVNTGIGCAAVLSSSAAPNDANAQYCANDVYNAAAAPATDGDDEQEQAGVDADSRL